MNFKPCKYELPYPIPFVVAPSAQTESWVSYTYRGSSTTRRMVAVGIAFCAFFSIGGLLLLYWKGWGSITVTRKGYPVPTLILFLLMVGGVMYYMWIWRLYNRRFEVTVSFVDGSCRFCTEREPPVLYTSGSVQVHPSKLYNEKHRISLVVIASGAHRSILGAFRDPTFAVGFAEQLSAETGLPVVGGEDPDLEVVQGSMRLGGQDAHAMESRIQDTPMYV